MNQTENPDANEQTQQRVVALEEWMMHVDQLLKELNAVACSIQDRLDQQDRKIEQLSETAQRLVDRNAPERTLEDEKPPHY